MMVLPTPAGLADVLARIAQIRTLLGSDGWEPEGAAGVAAGPGAAGAPGNPTPAPALAAGGSAPVGSFSQALASMTSATPSGALGAGTEPVVAAGSTPTADLAFVAPLMGATVTQPFGPTDCVLEPPATVDGVRYAHFHDGVDLAASLGTAVHAAAAGRVIAAGRVADGAVVVAIEHADGSITRYAHLAPDLPVQVGTLVRQGDVIGSVGMTGNTTGPHLHFELWHNGVAVDPMPWLRAGALPVGSVANSAPADGAAPGPGTALATPELLAQFGRIEGSIPYGTQIRDAAAGADLDPFLLAALVQTESGFDPSARSWAGAEGLTQLMPATAQELGVSNPFDPEQSLQGGARYLQGGAQQFGRVDLALAAYHDGRGVVRAAGGVPDDATTHAYIDHVVTTWNSLLKEAT